MTALNIFIALAVLAPIVLALITASKFDKAAYNLNTQLESLRREAYIQAEKTQNLERSLHDLQQRIAFDHGILQQVLHHLQDDGL
jgi:uncharacterized protein (DUF2344 family)